MAVERVKRFFTGVVPVVLIFVLLLGSLYLMSSATQNSEQFGRLYILLLIVNLVELLMLAGLIGVNLGRLIRQYRNRATGSRLTTRLVIMFVILAVGPSSVLYYFSMDFVRRGIDSWFDVRVQQALEDSLNLSRTALDWRMRDMLRETEQMAGDLSSSEPGLISLRLNELRERSGATELTLVNRDGKLIAFGSSDPKTLVPVPVDQVILTQLRQGLTYIGLDPELAPDKGLFARIVINIPTTKVSAEQRMLQALFPVPQRLDELTDSVQKAYAQYERLTFLQGPLKFSFMLTLSLVLALSLFTAVWAAFFFARRLVAPIRILAIGTRSVAAGDYHRRLPVESLANDELGFLVKSFNTMMNRIASAQDEAESSRREMERQKVYLETVLGHLSSGVVTFNYDGRLRTANTAAGQILGVDLNNHLEMSLEELETAHEHLATFVEAIEPRICDDVASWHDEVVLFGQEGRQVLMCRGALLPGQPGEEAGYVVVFDDITALIQAQRDAAWGEVARRLAHEIKNPLTPIQLSAERLRHKYLPMMDEEASRLLDRSTHTIVQQVEAMKKMVQAFSDYARSPKLELVEVDLNALVGEVVELYRHHDGSLEIETDLSDEVKHIEADTGRLRQLLHNLIKNAGEAMAASGHPLIEITTALQTGGDFEAVELAVRDHGPGVPDEIFGKLFEPYVSDKPKGSGLGLAVVKKIVEEHNGVIWVENVEGGGARFIIKLPLRVGIAGAGAAGPDERQLELDIESNKKDQA